MPGTTPESAVMEFYNDAKIFLTGGTGFLGKVLIEKFLRVCPNVEHIYLLVRVKKDKDPQKRLKELFEDKLFEKLRTERPDFEKKVTCIPGDVGAERLSISDNDYEFLINEITHVFHAAATVRFNEKLKTALSINVLGTQEIVKFCKKCKHLRIFVHVSTAYAYSQPKVIGDEFYESPMTGKNSLKLLEFFTEEKLDSITPELLKPWPNTYAYTKAIAENVVRESVTFPTVIFRPGIVMGAAQEPLQGWIDNIYGPTGVIAAVGVGLMRVLYADGSVKANIVPVDYTVNAMISSAWEVGTSYKNTSILENSLDAPHENGCPKKTDSTLKIYNFVSDSNNSVTWTDFLKINLTFGKKVPSHKAIWYYTITLTKIRFFYYFLIFLFHTIPALLIDGGFILVGKKPQLLQAYKKIHTFTELVGYFAINNWTFQNFNTRKLWTLLNDADKKLFYFNMATLDWNDYFSGVIIGIRNYIFREDDNLLPVAKRKMFFFYLGHRFLQFLFVAICFWLSSKFFCMIFGISNTPIPDQMLMTSKLMKNST